MYTRQVSSGDPLQIYRTSTYSPQSNQDLGVESSHGKCAYANAIVKARGIGCCHFVSTHTLNQARKYYKSVLLEDRVEHFSNQIKDMEERIRSVQELFFRKAIEICKELNHPDKCEELINELRAHFAAHIEKFRAKNLHADAARLEGQLRDLNEQFTLGQKLFDIEAFFEGLMSKLHRKPKKANDLNQIYRVKTHFGREKLPGKFMRSSSSTSFNKKDTEVNSAFEINQSGMDYSKEHEDFDFATQFRHPSIFSVGANMANAYYTPEEDQIVVGNGAGLFANLASSPAASIVLHHEQEHRKMDVYAGEALNNGITGLGYVCKGTDESGSANEAGADRGGMVLANEQLSKQQGIEILPRDPLAANCYKIGCGIWLAGGPDDALRDPRTGIGYTSKAVVDIVGPPLEKHYLTYADSHESLTNPTIVNRYAQYTGKGDSTEIEVHYSSALYNKVFINTVDELGGHVVARDINAVWLETYSYLPYNPNGLRIANTMLDVGRRWRNERTYSLGGIDLEQVVQKSFALQGFPI